ncbi:hypothetical protein ACFSTI_22580 [Rhizorhabdus histidinilytica]
MFTNSIGAFRSAACGFALAVASLSMPAFAQEKAASAAEDAVDEIVVTATRRAANVQDIGIAVTALGATV